MRRIAFVVLFALPLLALPLLASAQAPDAPATADLLEPDVVTTPETQEADTCQQSAIGVEQETLQFALPFPIPHCGDYCETPGQSRGCIDTSGSSWAKVECTCVGTTWTC